MMKKILKAITKSRAFQATIAWIVATFMRLVFYTNKWQYINRSCVDIYLKTNKPFIACFWHNRLGLMTYARLPGMKFNILISGHADGRLIAKTISHHKVNTIAGSTSKGSSEAVRKVLQALGKGEYVGVTPDGPRGPRFSINPGLIQLARKAGVDLLPVAYATSRRVVFNSWDRFILPLPFGRGVFVYGEPVKLDLDDKEAAHLLRQRLIDICNQSDQLCGNDIIPTVEAEKGMLG